MDPILEISDLVVQFKTLDGVVHAVNGVAYGLAAGQTLGLVGESGCGKSVSALSIMRLIPTPPGKIASGEIMLDGRSLLGLSDAEIRHVRGRDVAMVFQDPMTSLNPVYTVGFQIMEALMLHKGMDAKAAKGRIGEEAADKAVRFGAGIERGEILVGSHLADERAHLA